MITTGYVWALAELYLKRIDEPTTCSDEYSSKNKVFISVHENDPDKLNDGTNEVECEHEEHRAHNKDNNQSH